MNNGASAQVAQKINDALTAKSESLAWLAEQSGIARETTRRKVGQGVGELTMGEIAAYARCLGVKVSHLTKAADDTKAAA